MEWSRSWLLVLGLGALLGTAQGEKSLAPSPDAAPELTRDAGPPRRVEAILGELTGDRAVHALEVPGPLPTGARLEILLGPSFRVLAEDALLHTEAPPSVGSEDTDATVAATCGALGRALPRLAQTPGDAEAAFKALTLAQRLVTDRRQLGHWGSSRTRAQCLASVTGFAQAYEREPPDFVAELWLDGEPLGSPQGFRSVRQGSRLTVAAVDAESAGRRLSFEIHKRGVGRVVYVARWVLPATTVQIASRP